MAKTNFNEGGAMVKTNFNGYRRFNLGSITAVAPITPPSA